MAIEQQSDLRAGVEKREQIEVVKLPRYLGCRRLVAPTVVGP